MANDNFFNEDGSPIRSIFRNKFLLISGVLIILLLLFFILIVTGIITFKDKTPPTIYLNGEKTINISIGQQFTDPGARALDNKDGIITDQIQKNGAIDTSHTGSYKITYKVHDKAGNMTTTTRTVVVTAAAEDKAAPLVTFSPNGSNTESYSYDVTITVTDPSGVSSIKYQWTTSASIPVEASFTIAATSGEIIKSPSGVAGSYYLWIYAEDTKGNKGITGSNVFKLKISASGDITAPSVSFNPNGNSTVAPAHSTVVRVSDGSGVKISKYKWTTSTIAPAISSFTTALTSGKSIASPSGATGDYYLWVYTEDMLGNFKTERSKVFKLGTPSIPTDTTPPTISFGTNGNSTYAKTGGTKVTVTDPSTVKVSKYKWTTSTSAPTISSFTTTFTSGSTLNAPSSVTGDYYLWIYAEDNKGNYKTERTSAFKLDNTRPSCSTLGGSSSWYNTSRTVSISCSDSNSGVNQCNGVSGTSTSKTYSSSVDTTYSYTVSDKAGNTNTCDARVRIDKIAPGCSGSGGWLNWSMQYANITISCSDSGGSGMYKCNTNTSCSGSYCSWSHTYTTTTSYTMSYPMEDKAGNKSTCTSTVGVDRTSPNPPIIGGSSTKITTCGSDAHSGISSSSCIRYCICSSPSCTCTPSSTAASGFTQGGVNPMRMCAKTVDKVGNSSSTVCSSF